MSPNDEYDTCQASKNGQAADSRRPTMKKRQHAGERRRSHSREKQRRAAAEYGEERHAERNEHSTCGFDVQCFAAANAAI